MKPFIVNRYDRIVFPSNFIPELPLRVTMYDKRPAPSFAS